LFISCFSQTGGGRETDCGIAVGVGEGRVVGVVGWSVGADAGAVGVGVRLGTGVSIGAREGSAVGIFPTGLITPRR
jgi:hypothetical protein